MKYTCVSALAIALSYFAAHTADAEEMKLICDNSMRKYLAVYDTDANSLLINPDSDRVRYTVKSVSRGEDGLVVKGKTVNGGPDFAAFFGDSPAISFGEDQVDLCQHS